MIYDIKEIKNKKFKRAVIKVFREDAKLRKNEPDKALYIKLFIISFFLILLSLFVPLESRWFTIISGFGCSGVASVVVAWLIDYSNYRHKEKTNYEFLEYLFCDFDSKVIMTMNQVMRFCVCNNAHAELHTEYIIDELIKIINDTDGSLHEWIWYYKQLGDEYSSVETSLLLTGEVSLQHVQLYLEVRSVQERFNSYMEKFKKFLNDKDAMVIDAHRDFCYDMDEIKNIFKLRNKDIPFILAEEDIEAIMNKRKKL